MTPRAGLMSLRNLAAICGTSAGIGGFAHGVGEVPQGSDAPEAIVFDSWAEGRIAENLGGEPATTLVPNLLITGILAIGISVALIAWSLFFLERRRAGSVLMLLSLLLLLAGGGFGPPVLGIGPHQSRARSRRG